MKKQWLEPLTQRRLQFVPKGQNRYGIASIDLLKMDVEGAEHEIVEADYPFIRTAVTSALIEYHEGGGRRSFERLVETLGADFDVTVVHPGRASGVIHARNRSLRPTGLSDA